MGTLLSTGANSFSQYDRKVCRSNLLSIYSCNLWCSNPHRPQDGVHIIFLRRDKPRIKLHK